MEKTVESHSRRAVTLEYVDAPGKSVAVAGSFNDWQPVKKLSDRNGDGLFVACAVGNLQHNHIRAVISFHRAVNTFAALVQTERAVQRTLHDAHGVIRRVGKCKFHRLAVSHLHRNVLKL